MVVLSVETRNQVAGNRTHGAIYPMVSAVRVDAVGGDAEHIEPVHYRKITVEDGRFARASSRIGHTGQHTDLSIPATARMLADGVYELRTPYVAGTLYSRNKYGATTRTFRLDLVRGKLQRPITRKGCTTWHDFDPAQYLD